MPKNVLRESPVSSPRWSRGHNPLRKFHRNSLYETNFRRSLPVRR